MQGGYVAVDEFDEVRRLIGFLRIVVGLALVAWLLSVGGLFMVQRKVLYPAAGSSGAIWKQPPPGYSVQTLATADGLEEKALYHPASGGKRTLLFFHGNGDTVEGSAQIVEPFVQMGYGAFLAEFRGYAGNPGSPTEDGLYNDGEAAAQKLARLGVPPAQTIVVGYSLGSGVASKVAVDHQPAGLALIAAFTGIDDVAQGHFPWLPARYLTRDRFPTRDRIAAFKGPLLLLHGANDVTVPPDNSVKLSALNPRAQLVVVPGEDHVVAFHPVATDVLRDWLKAEQL